MKIRFHIRDSGTLQLLAEWKDNHQTKREQVMKRNVQDMKVAMVAGMQELLENEQVSSKLEQIRGNKGGA